MPNNMTTQDFLKTLRYRMHEGELTVPASWEDQSMQMFRIPCAPAGNDASLIVTRDYHAASLEPTTYAEAQHTALKQKFADFRLITQTEAIIGGASAAVFEYRWTANEVTLRQRQAYVSTGKCMLILTLTARARHFEQHEPAWNTVLQSLRLSGPTRREEAWR